MQVTPQHPSVAASISVVTSAVLGQMNWLQSCNVSHQLLEEVITMLKIWLYRTFRQVRNIWGVFSEMIQRNHIQHWFRIWFDAARLQAITWAPVEQSLKTKRPSIWQLCRYSWYRKLSFRQSAYGATSDDKVVKLTTVCFQWYSSCGVTRAPFY